MNASPDRVAPLVASWLRKAADDLAMASAGQRLSPMPAWAVAFHAQQAVEKALKAHLVWRQLDFPPTHDLVTLLDLCDPALRNTPAVAASVSLTPYAVASRYPGFEPDPDAASRAVTLARDVVTLLRAALAAEGWTPNPD